jgi:hypothetical protein
MTREKRREKEKRNNKIPFQGSFFNMIFCFQCFFGFLNFLGGRKEKKRTKSISKTGQKGTLNNDRIMGTHGCPIDKTCEEPGRTIRPEKEESDQ